ncbi:MAG: 23S rRNA (adenine(2503)-C(2))-methyltransferase RlmN [Prevotellaceae bacterium]|jgi:23S rRNA (adenine2503-C2)-methyltransferase|nr:23S rRNA (adenine(2503)-C(2))-methyltransferase RlmN [Prevotellaceae bacterium]
MAGKPILLGSTLPELEQVAAALAMPRYAARQIASWLYGQRVADFAAMSNLSAAHRAALAERYALGRYAPAAVQASRDGTTKLLFAPPDGQGAGVEAVLIPEEGRATLCVSSQAGCRMGCRFCMTARMGFGRHLAAGEMLNQLFSAAGSERLTNLVLMGMGEPLDNLEEVLRFLAVATAPWGMGWSPTRITLSTVGLLPALRRFLDESRCQLAISLHSPFADERQALMPAQRAHPIADVLSLLRRYRWEGQRRVSFEYIMLAGVNDSPRHAAALAAMLGGLSCRVNLLHFHQIPDSEFRSSPPSVIDGFRTMLAQRGLSTTVRTSRGEDIGAACGMLATQQGASLQT